MKIRLQHQHQSYHCDLSQGIDLSSPMGDPARELKAWFTPDVAITPVQRAEWIGSVAKGSPVNFFDIAFNPHGNGTHTECYGHIAPEHHSVNQRLKNFHLFCRVFHLEAESRGADRVVSLRSLLAKEPLWDVEAMVILVGDYEAGHDFSGSNPVYFEAELLAFLRDKGVKHFLTNLPSVDREEDGGALLAHHAFWQYPEAPREEATITELLLPDARAVEGLYLLNLQVAAFENDASPSRPLLFPLQGVPHEG